MTLSTVTNTVRAILKTDPYLDEIEIISSIQADHNQRLETALRDKGIAIVVVQAGGRPVREDAPKLLLTNELVVTVLENPTRNQSGKSAIEAAERVMQTLHQCTWPGERGLRHRFQVDTPAYEAGPLDSGLIIFFCNFLVRTLQ